jgi:Tfp pilus assembly protein PilX
VVLLFCLLFLAALTMLGLSASAETVMQDMLSGNLQETQRARQSATAAQAWAEQWLFGLSGAEPLSCAQPCQGLLIHTAGTLPAHPETGELSWWMANGHEAGIDPLTGQRVVMLSTQSNDPPLWVIERVQTVHAAENGATDDQVWYRILARGSGQTGSGISVVESIVTRPWIPAGTPEPAHVLLQDRCPGFNPGVPCHRVAWRSLR